MTETQIIKRYQFDGMDNIKLYQLKMIFDLMFNSIVEDFIKYSHEEPGYNYTWRIWCAYE